MPHDPFYWSSAWRSFRASILTQRPTCEVQGCGHPAKHVDHRIARAKGGAPFDPNNIQALCASCHSRKTGHSDGSWGNTKRDYTPRAVGCDANGSPLDKLHRWNKR